MLRFGLVGKMKTANQTKPNHAVKQENDLITFEPNAVSV